MEVNSLRAVEEVRGILNTLPASVTVLMWERLERS